MKNIKITAGIAFIIWAFTALLSATGLLIFIFPEFMREGLPVTGLLFAVTFLGSSPSFFAIWLYLFIVAKMKLTIKQKINGLFALESFIISGYGVLAGISGILDLSPGTAVSHGFVLTAFAFAGILFVSAAASSLTVYKKLVRFYSIPGSSFSSSSSIYTFKKISSMDTINYDDDAKKETSSNKLLIKGLVKPVTVKKQLIILPQNLDVKGEVFPESRPRSIYKVLLYKSRLNISGTFKPAFSASVNIPAIDFANAKICFGLSDFKGIEEEIFINVNGQHISLDPGLPLNDLDTVGLSAPVTCTPEMIEKGFNYDMQVRLKGSEQLHFMPLSANSKFSLSSSWASPSFDGYNLPNERVVTENGFRASWNFNRANLPFGTVLQQGSVNKANLAFGVSMLQPADQYSKTMRSVKYAILIIGLSFGLFFLIEILQHKPLHPVQYVLVGLALVIFYSLLLSISEYILFDHAYLLAATATIILISLYARSHFNSWASAGIFAGVLSALYGFIFVLIRLEDTALVVGSTGLFIVLALVMYASRKVNWYGSNGGGLKVQSS